MSCASTGRRTRVGRLRSGRAGKANAALYHLTALFRWHASFIEFRPACTHGRSTRTAHTLYPRVPKTAWFSLTDIHVSLLSRKNTGAQARSGERALFGCGTAQLAFLPLGGGSCLRRTRHPFAVSGPKAVTED